MDRYQIILSDHEVANLLSALQASMYSEVKRSPLFTLNSGDWIGQIIQKLKIIPTDTPPNLTPDEYAEEACKPHWGQYL